MDTTNKLLIGGRALAFAIVGALALAPSHVIGATEATLPWQPTPPGFDYSSRKNLAVQMDDGVTLRVDEYYPTDPQTGKPARGRFPVLLQQTPYGKDQAVQNLADYFVRRGYVLVIADIRGFAKSQGQASWFGARMGRDGAALVEWASKLEAADGKVGLMGCSFLGVAQFFTAAELGPASPVKAMAPFCVDSNFYRDLTAFGGIPTQFALAVRAVTVPGVDDDPATDPYARMLISSAIQDDAYYGDFWRSLNVTTIMPKVVSLGIPVLSESGWQDIFPGGNIDLEIAAQNASLHRPIDASLTGVSSLGGHYQAIVGNWTHAEHMNDSLLPILLRWFDTWLKGRNTGIADTARPFHLFMLGANRWIDSATYPLTDQSTTFHLLPGPPFGSGSLQPAGAAGDCAPPAGTTNCSQTLLWAPEGPGATLTFETARLNEPINITGPGNVSLFLRSTRPEVELSATLFDVDSDGH